MMPAANQGVGMNMGFPDVCTTPAAPAPIPIPYPNIGMNAMSMPFVPNVLVSMAPAQNMGAKPMLTNGDNAGVAHPLFMQPGGTTVGNPRILMGGMPASHLCVPTYGNNFNNPAGSKIVPSVTNVLLGAALAGAATAGSDPAGLDPVRFDPVRQLFVTKLSSQRLPHGILRIRLAAVSLDSDACLARALASIDRDPRVDNRPSSILLDLRNNPGGSIAAAMRIAALLVSTGCPIAIANNRQTASAAEMLAAALRDDERVTTRIFGQRSFGKGRVQPFWLSAAGMQASAPATEVLRATGAKLDQIGLQPDHETADTDADILHGATRWLRSLAH